MIRSPCSDENCSVSKKFTNTCLVWYAFLHTGLECDLLDGSYTKLAVVDVKMHVDFPVFFLNSLHFPVPSPSPSPSHPLAPRYRRAPISRNKCNVFLHACIYRQSAFTRGGRIHHTQPLNSNPCFCANTFFLPMKKTVPVLFN